MDNHYKTVYGSVLEVSVLPPWCWAMGIQQYLFCCDLNTSLCFPGTLTAAAPLIYDDYEMDGECHVLSNNGIGGIM